MLGPIIKTVNLIVSVKIALNKIVRSSSLLAFAALIFGSYLQA
jgi:hypothetical protein